MSLDQDKKDTLGVNYRQRGSMLLASVELYRRSIYNSLSKLNLNNDKLFKAKALCETEEITVPLSYGNDKSVRVLIHTPLSLVGKKKRAA